MNKLIMQKSKKIQLRYKTNPVNNSNNNNTNNNSGIDNS